ncbi:apple protein [Diplodia corticola]|uniref:Apple protein n=1 Tax=Diplodia corticola TaxID=236234 RepID=A0A1J9RZQ1_9PEZI|nr:apple protein [Diplodia corticola]OJD33823.1 apple protein [Diplodia corticola]
MQSKDLFCLQLTIMRHAASLSLLAAVLPGVSSVVLANGDTEGSLGDAGAEPVRDRTRRSESSPRTILLPDIHWDHDTHSLEHVTPIPPGSPVPLFYTASDKHPDGSLYVSSFTPTFNHTTVVLDHTDRISTVAYDTDSGDLKIDFNCPQAYSAAVDSWLDTENPLLLITYTPDCGNHESGERCFFEATNVDTGGDDLSLTVSGHPQDYPNVVEGVSIEWGSMVPPSPQSDTDCGAAVDPVNGLPTACLGPDFDHDLDEKMGYSDLTEFEWADDATREAPDLELHSAGLSTNNTAADADDLSSTTPDARRLRRRREEPPRALSKRLLGWRWLDQSFQSQYDFKIPSKQKPPRGTTIVHQPWKNSIRLFNQQVAKSRTKSKPGFTGLFNVYCVDCGAEVSFGVKGAVKSSRWGGGLEEAWVETDVKLKMGMQIGIEAGAELSDRRPQRELFTLPISGVTLPGLLEMGPALSVGIDYKWKAAAYGTVLAGAQYSLPLSTFRYDFLTGHEKYEGWFPQFDPKLEAKGAIMLSAEVGLPVTLKLHITALQRSFDTSLGIVDRPSLKFVAQAAAEISSGSGNAIDGGFTNINGCTGISTRMSWKNEVYVKAKLKSIKPLLNGLNRRFPIKNTGKELTRACIPLGKQPGPKEDKPKPKQSTPKVQAGDDTQDDAEEEEPEDDAEDEEEEGPDDGDEEGEDEEEEEEGEPEDDAADDDDEENDEVVSYDSDIIRSSPYKTKDKTFTWLVNAADGVQLLGCVDDNFYIDSRMNETDLDKCNELNEFEEDDLVATSSAELLYYYGDTMDSIGVSRLRKGSGRKIPGSAIHVLLVKTKSGYIARDDYRDEYYPVSCTYKDKSRPEKVFVVSDVAKGIKTLQSAEAVNTITGGAVSKCRALNLEIGNTDYEEYLGELD